MATGMVVGLSRYRDDWNPTTLHSDEDRSPKHSTGHSMAIMSSSSHHRSYSDAPNNLAKFRLPPISNLIESTGRPNVSYNSPFQGPHIQSPFSTGLSQHRPPPIPSDSARWSPNGNSRTSYQPDQPLPYDTRHQTEPYHHWNNYRRSTVAVPQSSTMEARNFPPPILHQSIPDQLSPNAHTTAKSVIGEDHVPGKGPCFLYDDGSVCPKYINGDTVNPKWGTTKAGKPRKRLGQACNTCREKKIKCDPSYPKCTQCQKFGRECRFEAPSRVPNKSPKMRSDDSPATTPLGEDSMQTRRHSSALTDASTPSESGTLSSRAAGTGDEHLSPLTNDSNFVSDAPGPSKKVRLTQTEPEMMGRLQASPNIRPQNFALHVDPFEVDKQLTRRYLGTYFEHVNGSTFSLIPQRTFLEWAERTDGKSQVSKLLLYCMLAVACGFSKTSEKSVHAQIFASIAHDGVSQSLGHQSLQLIQARLIFALHEFQNGREEKAWDLCGSALRTACAMNLNTEDGIAQQVQETSPVYGLNSASLAEGMRRTFWIAYTMDNFGIACLSNTTTFNKADCFLRLPCSRRAFEKGTIPTTLIFDGEIQPFRAKEADLQASVGTLGYLAQIASLCADVRKLAFKSSHRASNGSHKRYTSARDELESQLRLWNENYTRHINERWRQVAPPQMDYPFQFGGLHLMYHYACMQLHRHVPHTHLARYLMSEYARSAYHHAEKALFIAQQLVGRKAHDIFDYHFAATSPISGYAIHYAIDILSAAGINARLLENQSPVMGAILNSLHLLDNLAEVWSSAKIQQKQVSDRVTFVMTAAQAGNSEAKIGFCMEEAMVTHFSKEEDLVYGTDRMLYLKSFDWADQIQSPLDLNTVSNKGKRSSYSVWKD